MKKVSIIILLMFLCGLVGCTNTPDVENYTMTFDEAFSVVPTITIQTTASKYNNLRDTMAKDINAILKRINDEYSTNIDTSIVSQINSNSGKNSVTVSDEFLNVLSTAISVSTETSIDDKSKYDITIYPVWKLWNFIDNYKEIISLPTDEELTDAINLVDYESIEIDGNLVYLPIQGQAIDLGSIVKGMACDVIRDYLQEKEIDCAFIDIGGNIVTMGYPIKNNNLKWWNVGIEIPFFNYEISDNYIGYFKASDDETFVTSGIYERYVYDSSNNMYHHILDPETGYPIENDILSLSIVGNISSMISDAMSTALFGMGTDKALEFVSNKEYGVVIITDDKKIYISEQIKDNFVLNSDILDIGYSLAS